MNNKNRSSAHLEERIPELVNVVVINDLRRLSVLPGMKVKSCSNLGWSLRQKHQRIWMEAKATVSPITDLLPRKR